MKNELFSKFGYCVIPTNTLLYRAPGISSTKNYSFFGLKRQTAGIFGNEIQVWRTKRRIDILFSVEYINRRSIPISSIPQLYKDIFPEDPDIHDDLDIKMTSKMSRLSQKLFSYNIGGFLTSVEDNSYIEVCLFDAETNSNQLALITITTHDNTEYYMDSLRKLTIRPPKTFYQKTQQSFLKHSIIEHEPSFFYRQHKSSLNYHIKEMVENGGDKKLLSEYYFDLRLKLKV